MRCEVEEIARDVVEEIPAVDALAVTGENIVALRPASRKFRGADLGEEQRHAVLRIGQPGNGIYAGERGGYRRGIAALAGLIRALEAGRQMQRTVRLPDGQASLQPIAAPQAVAR